MSIIKDVNPVIEIALVDLGAVAYSPKVRGQIKALRAEVKDLARLHAGILIDGQKGDKDTYTLELEEDIQRLIRFIMRKVAQEDIDLSASIMILNYMHTFNLDSKGNPKIREGEDDPSGIPF